MNKKIIYEEVIKLGGGVHRKGFEYVVSGVEKLYNNPHIGTIKLYNDIAKEFNDTPSRVERAIRYYVQMCMIEGDKEKLKMLNMKTNKTGNPVVTEFLRAITIYLKIKY